MAKKYIMDTNALIQNPDFIKDNDVLIPPIVIRELENLEKKRTDYNMLYRIRQAKRAMMSAEYSLLEEVNEKLLVEKYLSGYDSSYGDNIILSYALAYKDVYPNDDIVIYTNDVLLAIKCNLFKIPYYRDSIDQDNLEYNGIKEITIDNNDKEQESRLTKLYEQQANEFNLENNEYLVLKDNNEISDILKYQGGKYHKIKFNKIKNEKIHLEPINTRQKLAFDLMQDDNTKIKLLTGHAGTGKDIIIFSHALEMLARGEINNIIWIGNPVITKGTQEIGFLPGYLEDKLKGNYMVLSDILGSEQSLQAMMLEEKIVIEYVGNLRSRTFNNSYVIVGEAQNYNIEQLKLIVGRIGYDSYLALNGDTDQSDISHSGLNQFVSSLKGQELFGCVELLDVERSEVAKLSMLL